MSNPETQDFEQELKESFEKSLAQKPKQDDSFDGAMKRIMWMKETVQKVNEESAILIKKHAGDNEELKKEMQAISLEQNQAVNGANEKLVLYPKASIAISTNKNYIWINLSVMQKLSAFIILTIISFHSNAQLISLNNTSSTKWHITKMNFGLGVNYDRFQSMSLNDLMTLAKQPKRMHRDLSNLSEETSTSTAGVAFYCNLNFSPTSPTKKFFNTQSEISVGVSLNSPKEAMVSFKNKDLDTSIVYCSLHGELALNLAYLRKGKWGKRWNWYYGLGTNIGATFGNEVIIMSGKYYDEGAHPSSQQRLASNVEAFGAKPIIYSRYYIPYGINYQLSPSLSAGLDFRSGIGTQFIKGEQANFIKKTGSWIVGMQYHF